LLPIPYTGRDLQPPDTRPDETALRNLICHIGRLAHEAAYIESTSGNISARLDANRILITPPGFACGFLQAEQITLLDLTLPVSDLSLGGELAMHLEIYRARADVHGIIHAHPPTAIALTIAGMSMRTCVVPESVIVLGLVPTAAYQLPGSDEGRETIRRLAREHDAILLAYHGALTCGPDLWQAYLKLEMLEHTAQILHRAAQLGPVTPLAPAHVAELLKIRRARGYWRAGDEDRFCEMCGAC
jgi:L-fuculose-phosphate aldolase